MSMNLAEVERLKELIIEPMIDTIREELKPLAQAKADHEARLAKLESNQKKALMGYAGIVAALTLSWNYVKAKWLSKFFT